MVKPKQIDWVVGALVRVSGFVANGVDDDITTAISAALAIAGRNGAAVPVQPSTGENVIGVIISGANNIVQIARTSNGEKIGDANNNEVYGRITEATGVYTLRYYVLANGAETPYNFAAATALDLDFAYRFDFARLPGDYAISVPTRVVNNDPRTAQVRDVQELLTVTGKNTLTVPTFRPTASGVGYFKLIVNEGSYTIVAGHFTINRDTKAITWNPAIAKFDLDTTDVVVAEYTTLE